MCRKIDTFRIITNKTEQKKKKKKEEEEEEGKEKEKEEKQEEGNCFVEHNANRTHRIKATQSEMHENG